MSKNDPTIEFYPFDTERKPSDELTDMIGEKCIDFTHFFNVEISKRVIEETFDEAPKFRNMEFRYAISQIATCFDDTNIADLLLNPPPIISEFTKYLTLLVPSMDLSAVLSNWPPVFPRSVPTSVLALRMILLLMKSCVYPEKIALWTTCSFPSYFDRKTKPLLKAATLCVTTDKSTQWALLTHDNIFMLINAEPRQDFKVILKKKIYGVRILHKEIVVTDGDRRTISKFKAVDENVNNLWLAVLTKKPPFFFKFLTKTSKSIPNILTSTILKVIMTHDSCAIHSLLSPNITSATDFPLLAKSLFNIAIYENKYVAFLNHFLSLVFSQPESTIDYLVGKKSKLHFIYNEFANRFSQKYFDDFLLRLVTYIDLKSGIRISDSPDRIEVILFTSLKLILDSISYIPNEIKLLASMLKSYAIVKFNNKNSVFRLISDFFANFIICPLVGNPRKCMEDYRYIHPYVPSLISNLLGNILTLSSFSNEFPQYESFEKRIKKHFNDKIKKFMFELADFKNDDEEEQLFVEKNPEEMVSSISFITQYISSNNETIIDELSHIMHPRQSVTSTALGWAVACGATMFFRDQPRISNVNVNSQLPLTINRRSSVSFMSPSRKLKKDLTLPAFNLAPSLSKDSLKDLTTIDTLTIDGNKSITDASEPVTFDDIEEPPTPKINMNRQLFPSSEFTYTYDSNVTHDAGYSSGPSTIYTSGTESDSTIISRESKKKKSTVSQKIKRRKTLDSENSFSIPGTPVSVTRNIEDVDIPSTNGTLTTEVFTRDPSIVGETIDSYSYTMTRTATTTLCDSVETGIISDSFNSIKEIRQQRDESVTYSYSKDYYDDDYYYTDEEIENVNNVEKTSSQHQKTETGTYETGSKTESSQRKFKTREIPERLQNKD